MRRVERFDCYSLPLATIYYDGAFNCRSSFTAQSVKDLAESIAANGQEFPVVVQPIGDMAGEPPPGYDWRLLAGHRRYMAIKLFLPQREILATVRRGLTEREAQILNLTENLDRKDLNPLEEALAIQRRFPDGASLRLASKELNRDTRWVHQRMRLLTLPESVQQQVAAGMLTLLDVEILAKLPVEEQAKAADEIAFERANSRRPRIRAELRRRFRRRKSKEEINKMVAYLLDSGLDGLVTRMGAWCAGYIDDAELLEDIRLELLKNSRPEIARPG